MISGYTVVVYLTEAVSYPLFGFLYSLLVIASVSASLYRTKADFLAFKVISQNEEKQILDKRLTRELPAENIALEHAGLKAADVKFVRSEYEIDDGVKQYDISFYQDMLEYEYEIDADRENIISFDMDR